MRSVPCIVVAVLGVSAIAAAASLPPAGQPALSAPYQKMWLSHVQPILAKSCFKCHGGERQKGGLDLREPNAIFAGGTDGAVVIPGRPGESPLYQRLMSTSDEHMPPMKQPQLSAEDISMVREWIATLPASTPSAVALSPIWSQTAPSLMESATRVKWEPPPGMEASEAIDHLIQARWQEQHVTGNSVCDDRTFVRRVYLDLAGRIPTRQEAEAFINSTETAKRSVLVDQLLAGDEFARHMAEVLDISLMGRKGKAAEFERSANGWFDYLQESVAQNRPWNQMIEEMIRGRPTSQQYHGAVWFLYEKKNNYQAMAEAVAPVAFGVTVACAQCHDHPLAHEIKQQHYWGLVAAFNRTANVDGDTGLALSESATGGFVYFTNLKKESQPAVLSFPNGKTVAEERPSEGAREQDSDDKYLVPPSKNKRNPDRAAVPKFSRRQAVADAATHDNPLLARAYVNRMWALLMGRGLVNPVDQMDSRHPPSHPELLAFLAADFEKSGYDSKRLVRTIVLSKTYQLDSGWKSSTPPLPELFAKGLEKPLPAEVLYRSLLVATGDGTVGSTDSKNDALRQALIVAFPGMFDVEYNATLQQAMFLTNNPLFDAMLKPRGQNLTARLLKLPGNTQRVNEAFVQVLGREPDEAEQAAAMAFLDSRNDRPEAAVSQFTWALLTGAEFLLNH
ncbi:MAG TPA: PSD1 and planctomycete cytochrome C domain-containing protein [Tepidisphaeraceae bacterium]|nr:PSD1 and planctomycete cytochrome C domain-containing protein [Tepidisphaeraceae bacterium]